MATVLEALNASLHTCMAESEQIYFLGEDVLDPYGGAFKMARGLSTAFPDRVVTTPVSEAGIVGLGVGMAVRGLRPVVEIMFGDFVTLAADQLINHAAKLRWLSQGEVQVPLVVRMPMGGGRGYGPTHSQCLEKLFLGVPGLRVVAACALDDPGRLLRAAISEDGGPVLFIEHKLLYPLDVQPLESPGEFAVLRSSGLYPTYTLTVAGAPTPSLSLAAYGYMAELARQAVRRLAYEHEVFAELVLYTQLSPFLPGPVLQSTARTHRLLTVEEGTLASGWGAEVVAATGEALGGRLRAHRLAAPDQPVPAAASLEQAMLPDTEAIVRSALQLANLG
jgi:pyruvate/2-oxoglutarate/acetoin dehydrogenase E1 component